MGRRSTGEWKPFEHGRASGLPVSLCSNSDIILRHLEIIQDMDTSFVLDLAATRRILNMIDDQPSLLHRKDCAFIKLFVGRHGEDDDEDAPPGIDEGTNDDVAESGSEDEEVAPPEAPLEDDEEMEALDQAVAETMSCRTFANRASLKLDRGLLPEALADAEKAVELNPDSARALRLRARTKHLMNDSIGAFSDMSTAQQIDYNDDFNALHAQMKIEKEKKEREAKPAAPPPLPNMAGAGVDFATLMNNPAFVNMAQNMMSNPEFMKGVFADMQRRGAP